MATLYVDRKGTELSTESGLLVLRVPGEQARRVPVALLERVVVHTSVTLHSAVLTALGEAGVPLVLVGGRSQRRMAMLTGPASADVAVRLGQMMRACDAQWCLAWSRRLVARRIRRQRMWLASLERDHPRRRGRNVRRAIEAMERALDASATAPDRAALRGIEGTAARVAFEILAELLPSSLGFRGRNRRPPRDPVNAAISLGATLLHADAVRAAFAHGLDPWIGFYHAPARGRESLACDLVEPWRPALHHWVWRMFAERKLRGEHFRRSESACLLGKTGRRIFWQEWERFAPVHRRGLRRTCRVLAGALREGIELEEPEDLE